MYCNGDSQTDLKAAKRIKPEEYLLFELLGNLGYGQTDIISGINSIQPSHFIVISYQLIFISFTCTFQLDLFKQVFEKISLTRSTFISTPNLLQTSIPSPHLLDHTF